MMLVSFTPGGFLTNFTDHFYYFSIAQLSDHGYYPFVNFWYEYPPLSAYLCLAVYRVSKAIHPGFLHYTLFLATLMLTFEGANLTLLYVMAREIWDRSTSLKIAWIYSCLLVPVFFWWGSLDLLVVFFCLLGLYWFLKGRHVPSAVALGLGVMVKYIPLILLGPIWRFTHHRRIKAKYILLVTLVSVLIFLPFAILSPSYVFASFKILVNRPPWETVWAVVEGNFGSGSLGPTEVHLDLTAMGGSSPGPSFPLWSLATLLLGGLYLYLLLKKRVAVSDKKGIVVFSAITFCIFFIWSRGWSPQWLVMLIPFILLIFPNWRGVLYSLTLSFNNFLEWPVYFVAAPERHEVLVLTVTVRTLIFAILLANLYQELAKGSA